MSNHTQTSECMYCPVNGRACINVGLPKVFLKLHILRWVTKYKNKIIGTILTDDLSDESIMLRQRGICYARRSSLIRNFS